MPNIQLVVNNATVKFEPLKSIAINTAPLANHAQKNTPYLPALFLTVFLHLLLALMLFQKNPTYMPASAKLPMMVSFLHENKLQAPAETTPAELLPTPIEPVIKKKVTPVEQKVVANTTDKAALLATEKPPEAAQIPDLNPRQNEPLQNLASAETAALTQITDNAVPTEIKSKPAYIAPSFGADYLHNPAPQYPNMARRNGDQGRVLLKVLVTLNGDAGNVTLEKSSGSVYLDEAAIKAVKNWKFVPARSNNEAVSGYVTVPISFSLES